MYDQTKSFIIEFTEDTDLEHTDTFIEKDSIKFTANNKPIECSIENINGDHILQLNDAGINTSNRKEVH